MEGGHTRSDRQDRDAALSDPWATCAAAIRLADRGYVYDNSVEDVEARLCIRTQDGQLRKVYGALPGWVSDVAQSLARHREYVDLRVA